MRFSTVALSLMALGIASATSAEQQESAGLVSRNPSRDFVRKMEVRNPKKHHKNNRGEQLITNGKLTWYGGGQLDNPACGGSTPGRNDHVVAVKQGGRFSCGDTVHIHHKDKMVAAKVVDYCAGCDESHVDASQGVFEKLANLDEGELNGVHIRVIPGGN